MKYLVAILETAVPVAGLVVPYIVRTHGKTKEILHIVRKLADAADGPEQS